MRVFSKTCRFLRLPGRCVCFLRVLEIKRSQQMKESFYYRFIIVIFLSVD
jgi:hypothetical protein